MPPPVIGLGIFPKHILGIDGVYPANSGIQSSLPPDPDTDTVGKYIVPRQDFREGEFVVARRYESDSDYNGGLGNKMDSSLFARVEANADNAFVFVDGGKKIKFAKNGSNYDPSSGRTLALTGGQYIYSHPNGTTFYFDSTGMVLSKTAVSDGAIVWAYDGTDKLTALQDGSNNNLYTMEYDSTLITKLNDVVGGRDVVYEYDTTEGVLTKTSSTCGSCTVTADLVYEYDSNGNILTARNQSGDVVMANLYDGQGRLTKQIRDTGVESISDFSDYSNLNFKSVDFASVTRHYYMNNQYGVTKGHIQDDARGTSVTYTYTFDRDENNYVTRQTGTDGQITDYLRDSTGGRLATILYDATNPITMDQVEYGEYAQITKMTDANGNVTNYTFGSNGNLLTRTRVISGGNLVES